MRRVREWVDEDASSRGSENSTQADGRRLAFFTIGYTNASWLHLVIAWTQQSMKTNESSCTSCLSFRICRASGYICDVCCIASISGTRRYGHVSHSAKPKLHVLLRDADSAGDRGREGVTPRTRGCAHACRGG